MMIRVIMLCSLLLISGAMIAQEKESVPTQEKSGDEGPIKLKKKKAMPVEPQEKPKDSAIVPSDKNKPESNPEKKKEKIYLQDGAKSYFFNNRDYHGVDPEPVYRYTLRVDGTFTDELCKELGLENGYTWKWSYENSD